MIAQKCLITIKAIIGHLSWENFWNIWGNINMNHRDPCCAISSQGVCVARGRQTGVGSMSQSHPRSQAAQRCRRMLPFPHTIPFPPPTPTEITVLCVLPSSVSTAGEDSLDWLGLLHAGCQGLASLFPQTRRGSGVFLSSLLQPDRALTGPGAREIRSSHSQFPTNLTLNSNYRKSKSPSTFEI